MASVDWLLEGFIGPLTKTQTEAKEQSMITCPYVGYTAVDAERDDDGLSMNELYPLAAAFTDKELATWVLCFDYATNQGTKVLLKDWMTLNAL